MPILVLHIRTHCLQYHKVLLQCLNHLITLEYEHLLILQSRHHLCYQFLYTHIVIISSLPYLVILGHPHYL